MDGEVIDHENARYKAAGSRAAKLIEIIGKHDHFIVPAEVCSAGGEKLKVLYFFGEDEKSKLDQDKHKIAKRPAEMISFDDSLEVELVPTSLILFSRSSFILPPKVKRISCILMTNEWPVVKLEQKNEYVSVVGKNNIMNKHPLEQLSVFYMKSRLRIRETVRFISSHSYSNSVSVKIVIFPSSIEKIGNFAFAGCLNLEAIKFKINSKIDEIGISAFSETPLKKIDFPSNLICIRKRAFYNCQNLHSISFPRDSSLSTIQKLAFARTNIEEVEIPAKVVSVFQYSFHKCKKLEKITFQENSSLISIEKYAFSLTPVESINFPSSIEKINNHSFAECKSLTFINFQEDSKLREIGFSAFENTNIKEITFPASVKCIGPSSFFKCRNLTSICCKDGSQLEAIHCFAFSRTDIEEIDFPSSLRSIEAFAFCNCENLYSITFDEDSSIEIIDTSSFENTRIANVIFPKKLRKNGCVNFGDYRKILSIENLGGREKIILKINNYLSTVFPVTKPCKFISY